jgi:hypothetical protein
MAIRENEVLITLHNKIIKHYEELGYDIPKYIDKKGRAKVKKGTKILVKTKDLTKKSNVKVTKICDDCGKISYNQPFSNLTRYRDKSDSRDRCVKCGNIHKEKLIKENVPYERSLEYYSITNNKKYLLTEFSEKNNILPSKIFKGSNDEYLWSCGKCKSEFTTSANSRTYLKSNCPFCSGKRVNETNCLAKVNPNLSKEWHPTKNGKLTPYNVTKHSNKDIWWKCQTCEYEWKAKVTTRDTRGCLLCSTSKGEKKIKEWLEEKDVIFKWQKEFNDLFGLGGRLLSYDFYLPKHNLLIEYQGQYHDGTANNQTKEQFKVQQEHDKRKKEYVKSKNIQLLEIWYWDFENIEQILSTKINKNKLNISGGFS